MLSSQTLTERAGTTVALKAENLQRTGSFKLRGALAKIAALGEAMPRRRGHRQRREPRAGGRLRGPRAGRAVRRVHARGGADRQGRGRHGARRERASRRRHRRRVAGRGARARATRAGSRSCTRSTIPTWSPGRAGSGSSCSRRSPTCARVVVPVGGGGLISGVAIAVKSQRPEVEVIGVQVAGCAPFPASLAAGRAGRGRPRR